MLSSSTYAVLRIALYTYLPSHLTPLLLRLLHTLHPRPPPPHTPLYTLHARLTHALILLLLLLYNLLEAIRSTPLNFYEVLGVVPSVDEGGLKAAFRGWVRRHHPDRPGVGEGGEEVFREIRGGYEALRDPIVRFAYDRFGADVLTWTQCTTTREYLRHGLMQSSGYHIVTGAGLLFFSAIGKPSGVAFWRYLLFAFLFASELALLLSPSPSHYSSISTLPPPPNSPSPTSHTYPQTQPTTTTTLATLFPTRVPYQHILFLHQLFMFVSIALSRVVPVLGPVVREWVGVGVEGVEVGEGGGVYREVMQRFGALVRAADRELYLMLHGELNSIQPQPHSQPHPQSPQKQATEPTEPGPGPTIQTLTQEMENMIIENKLRKEAPLRSFWETAVGRGWARERGRMESGQRGRAVTMFGNGSAGGEGKLADVLAAGMGLTMATGIGIGMERNESPGRLPSPRPSPPPPPGIIRRGSSYMRARSVSC